MNNNDILVLKECTESPFQLPTLSRLVRYYDDFSEKWRTIKDLENDDHWELWSNGTKVILNFENYNGYIKQWLKWSFSISLQELSPATNRSFYFAINADLTDKELQKIAQYTPYTIKMDWAKLLEKNYHSHTYQTTKILIKYLCQFSIGEWNTGFIALVSSLSLPFVDKYANVRSGNVFLSNIEESQIINFLNRVCKTPTNIIPSSPKLIKEIKDAAILCCLYQFGVRPIQLASVKLKDIKIWQGNNEDDRSTHITFKKVKQRSSEKSITLTRKIKKEWASIINNLHQIQCSKGLKDNDRLFGLDSAAKMTICIKKILHALLDNNRSANDLRHTAAQRLVDAGATHEELANFLGHSDLDSGLVYFDISANQAERVNKALGISNVYSKVARIAHDKFINEAELQHLKGEQQIAGVPHGIIITGIGGCSMGQPICPYNPITSCYGCYKFMPINDLAIHQQVLKDMRKVVNSFITSGRSDDNTPAFLQLKHTINNIQSIIFELQDQECTFE